MGILQQNKIPYIITATTSIHSSFHSVNRAPTGWIIDHIYMNDPFILGFILKLANNLNSQ
jgi:hypothetical protein